MKIIDRAANDLCHLLENSKYVVLNREDHNSALRAKRFIQPVDEFLRVPADVRQTLPSTKNAVDVDRRSAVRRRTPAD